VIVKIKLADDFAGSAIVFLLSLTAAGAMRMSCRDFNRYLVDLIAWA
jgi:hypothetical protein